MRAPFVGADLGGVLTHSSTVCPLPATNKQE